MKTGRLDHLAALRERLDTALQAEGLPRLAGTVRKSVDLVITLCEVGERHGTGVLLRRIFHEGQNLITIRSHDFYDGEQEFGAAHCKLDHEEAGIQEVFSSLISELGHLQVGRILCVPYNPSQARTALAAQDIFGAKLCTWVMDDQNIEADGIPDDLLGKLLSRSALRLAISPELKQAYEAKFGLPFTLAPPAVDAQFLQRVPTLPDTAQLAQRCGLVFGNIWGERWLSDLIRTLTGSGLHVDWYSGAGTPWMNIDHAALGKAGIRSRPFLPECELVEKLRNSPFVIVPSGTFDGQDAHRFVARLSLPSRLPYLAVTAGTPALVLGHPDTAAARFVTRHNLGLVVPYHQESLLAAIEAVCTPQAQTRHRAAAAALAPSLSADGMQDWIWRSLEIGGPFDNRFDLLELAHE